MGVRVDLIDRAVYAAAPDSSPGKERSQKINEDNGEPEASFSFNERDKFLLSDKDILPMIKPKAEAAAAQVSQPLMSRQQSQVAHQQEDVMPGENLIFTGVSRNNR